MYVMHDAPTASRRQARPGPVAVNTTLFINACAAKGARDDAARAELLGMARKSVYRLANGYVEPKIYTALDIAERLGVCPSALWPGTKAAA